MIKHQKNYLNINLILYSRHVLDFNLTWHQLHSYDLLQVQWFVNICKRKVFYPLFNNTVHRGCQRSFYPAFEMQCLQTLRYLTYEWKKKHIADFTIINWLNTFNLMNKNITYFENVFTTPDFIDSSYNIWLIRLLLTHSSIMQVIWE